MNMTILPAKSGDRVYITDRPLECLIGRETLLMLYMEDLSRYLKTAQLNELRQGRPVVADVDGYMNGPGIFITVTRDDHSVRLSTLLGEVAAFPL